MRVYEGPCGEGIKSSTYARSRGLRVRPREVGVTVRSASFLGMHKRLRSVVAVCRYFAHIASINLRKHTSEPSRVNRRQVGTGARDAFPHGWLALPPPRSILDHAPRAAFPTCHIHPPKPSAVSSLQSRMSFTPYPLTWPRPAHALACVTPSVVSLVGPIHSVVILHGLPGAGKSTIAAMLSRGAGFISVSFDAFWATSDVTPPQATPVQRDAVYQAALEAVYRYARTSNVVVDCTSRASSFRASALLQLWARNCHVMFVCCDLDPGVARERVILRLVLQATHLGRGAGHFDAIAPTFEPFTDWECRRVARVVVNTGGSQPEVRDLLAETPSFRDQYIYEAIRAAVQDADRISSTDRQADRHGGVGSVNIRTTRDRADDGSPSRGASQRKGTTSRREMSP